MCDLTKCGSDSNLPTIEVPSRKRRQFIAGTLALPLSAVLAIPELSRAAAARTETVELTTSGGRKASAVLARPDSESAPAILLVHEWWGLNDQIKSVAAELANQGFLALAVDLYGGNVATTRESARELMQSVNPGIAGEVLQAWIGWLRSHDNANGKVGTVGWCFGGGWSLRASVASPVNATVIYYGDVSLGPDDLASLEGPVLGHFATRDGWIDQAMVDGFEMSMDEAGKESGLTVYWYEADHAFANPSSARYDESDAALAWERTTDFFRENLAG